MSDKSQNDAGCAENAATSAASLQPGYVGAKGDTAQGTSIGSAEGIQGYGFTKANAPEQAYAQQQAPATIAGAAYAHGEQAVASSSPAPQAGAFPAAGQPQAVTEPWHEPFHLKPANGYMDNGYMASQFMGYAPQGQPETMQMPQQYGSQAPAQGFYQQSFTGTGQFAPQSAPPFTAQSAPQFAPQFADQFAAQSGPAGMTPEQAVFPNQPYGMYGETVAQESHHGRQGHCGGKCESHHPEEPHTSSSGAPFFGMPFPGMDQGFNPFAFFGQAAQAFGGPTGTSPNASMNPSAGMFQGMGQAQGMNQAQGMSQNSHHDDFQNFEHKYGQLFEIYNDIAQGKPDPAKIMNFLTSTGTYFWKGALVGAVLTLVLTNSSVKATIKDCLGGLIPNQE